MGIKAAMEWLNLGSYLNGTTAPVESQRQIDPSRLP